MAISRRQMIAASASAIAVPGGSAVAAVCSPQLTPTESIQSIPEYIPGAPLTQSLLDANATGQRIRLFGRALTTNCQPLQGARFDFWHTDSDGLYDMAGFRFRGAQLTDKDGRFHLDTVMPGPYNGPRHVHYLLATRLGARPQPLMLSSVVFFPTREEYAQRPPAAQQQGDYLNPDALRVVDGVLMAPCDIILETM